MPENPSEDSRGDVLLPGEVAPKKTVVSKTLPYDLQAEQSCIGSILIKNSLFDQVFSKLRSIDFYDERNQIIVEALTSYRIENGAIPIDLITLTSILEKEKKLDRAGGKKYLMELELSVPTTANVDYYAKIVKEKSILRHIIDVASTAIKSSTENENSDEIIEKTQQLLYDLVIDNYQSYQKIIEETDKTIDMVQRIIQGKEDMGLKTHFKDLDKIISGLQRSNLVIIGGRTGMGKTAFALSLLLRMARNPILDKDGKKVAVPIGLFSVEMSTREICLRLLSSMANMTLNELKKEDKDNWDQPLKARRWDELVKANDRLRQLSIFIDDTAGIKIDELCFKARRMVQHDGVKIIIIDYLQLITSNENNVPREQQISSISKQLKNLARELDVPVVTLTQLNRAAEYREDKTPRLSDIRESGAIEQDADLVMFIHRPSYDKTRNKGSENEEVDERVANIVIAKNRHGPTGLVSLDFDAQFMRFGDYDNVPSPSAAPPLNQW